MTIVWEYAKRIAEVISTRYRDKLPFTVVRRIELAIETMDELQFLEELYFAVRTLRTQYLIEKAVKL
jgi:hypothetical protein